MYLPSFNIEYFPIPKCACSSMKLALFQLENGFPFKDFRCSGGHIYIHSFIPTMPFSMRAHFGDRDTFRFAIIRDPIDRFLSAYTNRVIDKDELSGDCLARTRSSHLPSRPDIGTFVDLFYEYRSSSESICHHTDPASVFIGSNMAFFNKLIVFSEVSRVSEILHETCKIEIQLPMVQTSSKKLRQSDLTFKQLRKIKSFYEADYRMFKNFLL
jgi:hypothetical protein